MVIGYSTTIGTVQRWVLSSHVIAEISEDFQNAINGEKKSSTRKDLKPSRMLFDEENVNRCQDLIVTWNNQFEMGEDLILLSAGKIPDDAVKKDLLNAQNIGIEGFHEYVTVRITSSNTSFCDKMTKNRLRTFSSKQSKNQIFKENFCC